jgi:hypothetical protein
MKLTSEVYIRLAENEPAFICTVLGVCLQFPITLEPEILPDIDEESGTPVRIRRTSKAGLCGQA